MGAIHDVSALAEPERCEAVGAIRRVRFFGAGLLIEPVKLILRWHAGAHPAAKYRGITPEIAVGLGWA